MRRIDVLLETWLIDDGAARPPVVGEFATYHLSFGERAEDPSATTFTVRAAPLGDGTALQGLRWDGTLNGPPRYPTLLHGDGWVAQWAPERSVVGEVQVRGLLMVEHGALAGPETVVRGRIIRLRAVTDAPDATGPQQRDRRLPCEPRHIVEIPAWPVHPAAPVDRTTDLTSGTGTWKAYTLLDRQGEPLTASTYLLVELDLAAQAELPSTGNAIAPPARDDRTP